MQRSSSSSNSSRSSGSHSYSTETPPKAPPETPRTEPQGAGGRPMDEIPKRPTIPVLALSIEEVKEKFDKRIAAAEHRRVKWSPLPQIHLIVTKDLPRAIRRAQRSLPQQDILALDAITAHAEGLIDDPANHVMPEFSGDEGLSADVRHVMECMQAAAANHEGNGADAKQERRCLLIDCLGAVARNEFRSDAGRLAANAANVFTRTFVFVLLAKFIQDAVAFEVSKAAALGGQEGSLRIAGILALILAPTLNVLGGILSGVLGTANLTSVIPRLWLGMLYLGLLLACWEIGVLRALMFNLLPPAIYCLVRDGLNFWAPCRDNVGSVSKPGVLAAGGIYSLLNAAAGVVFGKTVPTAGAGALPRTGNETERMTPEFLAALKTAVMDDRASWGGAGIWATVEFGDDLILPTILRWIQTRDYRKKEALNMQIEAAHSEYIGELTDLAKELLKTPRKDRQRKIDEKNLDLYRRELERMKKLGKDHQLDEVHQRYQENLLKELRVYQQTKTLGHMWGRLSVDPNCLSAEELADLKHIEMELGVYKTTRELNRLKSLDVGRIDEAQSLDLAALEAEVARYWEIWQVMPHADPSQLSEEEKVLLKRLVHEFVGDDTDVKPARLRPLSSLQSNVQYTPDFTRFAQMIRNTCRLHRGLTPKERKDILEELYPYEFVRLYLPGSLTSVEQDVLASISKEKPKIRPSELLKQLKDDVDEERRVNIEGIRIGLGFLPANVSSVMEAVERFCRQLLVTDAARQSAIGAVFALLVLMNALMGDRIKDSDENTQLTIWNLMAGFGVFMVYWALIMMHSEGARGGGVYRPGAERTLPPLRERQTPEDLYTPRTERYEPDDRGISESKPDSEAVSETDSESTDEYIHDSDEDIELGRISPPRIWAE